MNDYTVLAIYEGHIASASLMINGEIIAATHEERFSRLKSDHGFPLKAAEFCLNQAGVEPKDINNVVMIGESYAPIGVANIIFKRAALYTIEDWIYENEHYWKPLLLEKSKVNSYFHIMGGWDRAPEHYYDLTPLDMDAPSAKISEVFNQIRKRTVEKLLDIPADRVVFAPHYLTHHYHAYFSGVTRGEDVVVMHLEGSGGKYNSAVSVPTKNGLKIIGGSNESNLGRLYQWITLLMGMKPYHHEYKIMGLAPYATEHEVIRSFKVFEQIFKLEEDALAVIYNHKPSDLYFYFLEKFKGHRFDGIAGALQLTLEKWITKWVKLVLKKTGCKRVCYGGGVAMNVKANMLISRIEGLDYLYVPISPSDESNVFGAGYWLTEKHMLSQGRNLESIPSMKTPYLGIQYNRRDVLNAIEQNKVRDSFFVYEGIGNEYISKLLLSGKTVATCQGRSEFGQRSLGNRSILAHPSYEGIVHKINSQIKYRDFWMPFCPTILNECQDAYLENHKKLSSDYMTIGFPSRESIRTKLQNVIHPGDKTARPQILKKETNPNYYDLISRFKSMTGIGALLNTSFNLHGEPIVDSPSDAIQTFLRSGLDTVWMEDILISRQKLDIKTDK